MKAVLVILIALLVFFACATLGYQLAMQTGVWPGEAPRPTAAVSTLGAEQHNLVIIQVDQLDADKPKLVSVWYVNILFLEDTPPTLSFAQLYSPESSKATARNLERNFSLNSSLEPSNSFWKAVKATRVEWEAYFVVDNISTQRILEWVNGSGDYITPFNSADQSRNVITQTCQSLAAISSREGPAFDWAGLAPDHFHSDMHMEIAMAYWNRITKSTKPISCLPVPND